MDKIPGRQPDLHVNTSSAHSSSDGEASPDPLTEGPKRLKGILDKLPQHGFVGTPTRGAGYGHQ
jgi:hypothetical protein